MDFGPPISYEALAAGTKVVSSDGTEVGTVVHVLADESVDVFDGIVVAEGSGVGHRFADADDIEEIHQDAVVLRLSAQAAAQLPEPSANPAVMRQDPAEGRSNLLEGKLRRAWDLLSGNY
jgi:uncharacterized protein YrrD